MSKKRKSKNHDDDTSDGAPIEFDVDSPNAPRADNPTIAPPPARKKLDLYPWRKPKGDKQ